jgi:hypothetical protein
VFAVDRANVNGGWVGAGSSRRGATNVVSMVSWAIETTLVAAGSLRTDPYPAAVDVRRRYRA